MLEILSADLTHLFSKHTLSLLNLIFQRNEYLLTRKVSKFELFLKILVNLGDTIESMDNDSQKFIIEAVCDYLGSRGN
jgi:hypothetical protein